MYVKKTNTKTDNRFFSFTEKPTVRESLSLFSSSRVKTSFSTCFCECVLCCLVCFRLLFCFKFRTFALSPSLSLYRQYVSQLAVCTFLPIYNAHYFFLLWLAVHYHQSSLFRFQLNTHTAYVIVHTHFQSPFSLTFFYLISFFLHHSHFFTFSLLYTLRDQSAKTKH